MATVDRAGSRPGRFLIVADGFLFTAALDITFSALVIGAMTLFLGGVSPLDEDLGPVAGALASLAVTVLPVLVGATLALMMHGRRVGPADAFGMLLGVVIGGVAMASFFGGLVVSRIPADPDSPPWVLIGLVAAIAVAVAIVPLVDAVRDLRSVDRRHVRLDWLRIVSAAAVSLLAVVVLPSAGIANGAEYGEAGIFMVPVGIAGGLAVLGAELFSSFRHRRTGAHADAA